jgi:ABC-2 type transport system permease protein
MENQPAATPVKSSHRWDLARRVMENPVIVKELRGRMRGRRAIILLTAYLALIGLVIGLVYIPLSTESSFNGWDPDFRQGVGKAIFGIVVILELLLVSFIGPALTSGSITSEREHQTFDLLRTTTLPARSLIMGKLWSSLMYLLLLIFTALPIESLAFLLGGVGLAEIVVSSLMLVITAAFYCTLGLFFSSFMKRTVAATVTSYMTIVLSYVLLGVAFFMTIQADILSRVANGSNVLFDAFMAIFLWVLISTNPLLAAIVSETILIDDQSMFTTSTSIFGNHTITLPSPWIPYTLIYLGLILLMIQMSIRFVRRPDK